MPAPFGGSTPTPPNAFRSNELSATGHSSGPHRHNLSENCHFCWTKTKRKNAAQIQSQKKEGARGEASRTLKETATLELDAQLEGDLTVTRFLRVRIGPCGNQLTHIWCVDVGIRIVEQRVVEDIRERRSKRRPNPLAHRECLGQAEVVYIQARTEDAADSGISKATNIRGQGIQTHWIS